MRNGIWSKVGEGGFVGQRKFVSKSVWSLGYILIPNKKMILVCHS